jgi:hypothetical protein
MRRGDGRAASAVGSRWVEPEWAETEGKQRKKRG